MSYVDGNILPVPKKDLKAYARMAKLGAERGDRVEPADGG